MTTQEIYAETVAVRLGLSVSFWDWLLPWRAYTWRKNAMNTIASLYTQTVVSVK